MRSPVRPVRLVLVESPCASTACRLTRVAPVVAASGGVPGGSAVATPGARGRSIFLCIADRYASRSEKQALTAGCIAGRLAADAMVTDD